MSQILELPGNISNLLAKLEAPTRLKKHLQIVYSMASQVLEKGLNTWPKLAVDRQAVLFGAATHDIGKAIITSELYESGNEHEARGYQLLLSLGYPENLARFAKHHGQWNTSERTLEELLVSLSDILWNGGRIFALEELASQKIAERLNADFWEIYTVLDGILTSLASGADERLFYQEE